MRRSPQNTLSDAKGSQDYSAKERFLSDSARSLCCLAVLIIEAIKSWGNDMAPTCLAAFDIKAEDSKYAGWLDIGNLSQKSQFCNEMQWGHR